MRACVLTRVSIRFDKDTCDNVRCMDSKKCILDQNLIPHCVHCINKCIPQSFDQEICGANNVTYSSLCEIRRASCLSGHSIQVSYKGKCKGKLNVSYYKDV